MFCGLGTGGGAGSFQLFKRFMFAGNDDLRQGKVPVLEPRRLQFDAEPSGDFGLAQAHLLDFPPVELQSFQAVVQFQNKVDVFVIVCWEDGEVVFSCGVGVVFGENLMFFRFKSSEKNVSPTLLQG